VGIDDPQTFLFGSNDQHPLVIPPLTVDVAALPNLNVTTTNTITSTSTLNPATIDIGLKDIEIKALPPIKIEIDALPTIKIAVEPTRVHFPMHFHVGLSTLGVELLGLNLCGESMMIIEPYDAHETEKCCK
jgi:hypothetical protein